MTKWILNKSMYWELIEEELFVYATDYEFRKKIEVPNVKKFFEFLSFVSTPKTMQEIYKYSIWDIFETDEICKFLKIKNYLIKYDNPSSIYENRLENFVNTLPQYSYTEYLKSTVNKKILIIGLGTSGSYLLEMLTKLGFNNFSIIDGDKVENKNLVAQNFGKNDIGTYKSESISEKYSSDKVTIQNFNTMLKNYEHLKQTVDLSEFSYICNCTDDPYFNLDLLSSVFIEYPKSKLIVGGYSIFKEIVYLLSSLNYKSYLNELKIALNKRALSHQISENSGTIFNAIFFSFSTSKLIFDNITNISYSTQGYADFLQNNYFIGNSFEKNIFRDFSEEKKKTSTLFQKNSLTIKRRINKNNIFEKQQLLNDKYKLTTESYEYLNTEYEKDFFSYCRDLQKFTFKRESNMTFDKFQELVFEYVERFFSKEVLKEIKILFRTEKFQLSGHLYSVESSFTKKRNSNNTLIYSVDNTSNKYNNFLHEIFHYIYFMFNKNSYFHEKFVFFHHISFLNYFLKLDTVKELSGNFIDKTINYYPDVFFSLEYQKYLFLDDVKYFQKKFAEELELISPSVVVDLLNSQVDFDNLFKDLKYIYALEQNKMKFEHLVNDLYKTKEENHEYFKKEPTV